MISLHGTAISIDNANELPNLERGKFLDTSLVLDSMKRISAGLDLLFLGNDISESTRNNIYSLTIHGILPCGSKTTLSINGIEPHVDIKKSNGETEDAAYSRVERLVKNLITDDRNIEYRFTLSKGKDFLYFDHREHEYIRIHFKTIKDRIDFLHLCKSEGVKTYSNDLSTYYRVVSRQYEINLSGWNIIKNYTIHKSSSSKAAISLSIDVGDIAGIEDNDTLVKAALAQNIEPSIVKYENMILSSFDIEMIPAKEGRFPDADRNPNDTIFMICMTYHFVKKPDAILSVCLTLKECDPLESVYMVHCKSEVCLLATFARFMAMIQPDFITEFNGGGFDWRNVITKARIKGIISAFLEDMSIVRLCDWQKTVRALDRYHQEKEIKIGGATANAKCKGLNMQGFIGFDTLIVFKQLEPNADSHKLNECLKRCNLGSKDDLDVQEMFSIYKEGSPDKMKLVAHYCFIDTFKLQQLLLKKNVIQERREVAALSFTSLHDNFYYAGGGRMRNLLMNRGEKLGYHFDTQYKPTKKYEDAKFPGAFVVPPLKGMVKPMLRFDEFATMNNVQVNHSLLNSAYKYIEKHFNEIYHSPNPMDTSKVPNIVKSYIDYANNTNNEYPVSGLDYASLYPSIIMTYNISPEKLVIDELYARQLEEMGYATQFVTFPFCDDMIKAWFVRHNNDESQYSICGKLLIELFDRRASIKNQLKYYSEQLFDMELEMKPYIEKNDLDSYPRLAEYNEAKFEYIGYDSKQKAVKVFMNTLYGEMGNFNSCICAVEVAGSVTTMGRYNLRLAKSFVENQLKMKVHYGDSVVGDTPIMIKRIENEMSTKELIPIEELEQFYYQYYDDKEYVDYTSKNVYVMTENGYTKILKLIRHKTKKRLYRITTFIGSVVVTEDHSLLNLNKQKIKPQDCNIGTQLLHWEEDRPIFNTTLKSLTTSDIPNHIAFVKGFFFGKGNCYKNDFLDGTGKWSFDLKNENYALLNKCVQIFNNYYKNVKLNIVNTSNMYEAIAVGKVSDFAKKWSSNFYSSRQHKKVPQDILNGDYISKMAFIQGYYAAVGKKCINFKNQVGSQGLYLLLLSLGFNVNIGSDSNGVYRLTFEQTAWRCENLYAIQKIEDLGGCEEYVYDLETESHHFAAGIGQLVVHNTDSLYVACNPTEFVSDDRLYFSGKIDKLTYATRLVETTFDRIEKAKYLVNNHLVKDNGSKFLKMAYEEVLYPVAFLSKKKYYGVPHEENVNFYPQKLFLRGLEVVKRGASDVLKEVVNEVLRESMDIMSTRDIIDIIKDAILRVFNTNWDIEAFAKSKTFRPDKQNIAVQTMIKKYKSINYHTIPEPNVRFKCVICKYYPWEYDIQGRIKSKMSIGDRMELVKRVQEEGLEIDLEYYFDNELTGQFARLITFHDEFKNVTCESEEIDTSNMSEIEIDILRKEQYQKSEDALFKAAKKYIAQLAKHYSKAYTNKGSLYSNTWREVCRKIQARPEIQQQHLNAVNAILNDMFVGSTKDIKQDLLMWSCYHINRKYGIAIDENQKSLLSTLLDPVVVYAVDNKIDTILTEGALHEWKSRVVQFIRNEYDYEYICKNNVPCETMWDVLSESELDIILRDTSLFPALSADHAMHIIDLVSYAIGQVVPVDSMTV